MFRNHPAALALLGVAAFSAPSLALACCPSGGNTEPKAASGLGDAYPAASDVSADPNWRVYNFERDGIHYVQVNDASGAVRAAVGRIDGLVWVLPVGTDADRVNGAAATAGSVIYSGDGIEVRRTQTAAGDAWSIAPTDR
jgi:hypothetical protein